MKRMIAVCAAVCVMAGCSKADAGVDGAADAQATAQGAAEAAGAPSAADVDAAMKAGAGLDTGGRVHMNVGGRSLEMTDVTYCVQEASAGTVKMSIFVMTANNQQWAITLTGMKGMPAAGEYPVDPTDMKTLRVSLVDKTTGSSTDQWQQYDGASGATSITSTDGGHVKGTFDVTGSPKYPATSGPSVSAKGDFDATLAASCR